MINTPALAAVPPGCLNYYQVDLLAIYPPRDTDCHLRLGLRRHSQIDESRSPF